MMSRSTVVRRRYSASRVLSRRAAVRRLKSLSARAMWTVRRWRTAMWPRAVARCVLPTPTVIQDQGAVGAVEEPQGDQLVPEPLVVADGGGRVPGFGAHGGVQAGVLGAQRDGPGFAAGDFVGQDELEEVGVGHVVLEGEGEALGQGGGELAALEGAQGGFEVGAERVGQW